MSYRMQGTIAAKKITEDSVKMEIGTLVPVLVDGSLGKKVASPGGLYFPLVAPVGEASCVADIQVDGIAKLKVKDGEAIEAGDFLGVEVATGLVVEVADATVANYIGQAFEAMENGFVAGLLKY